MRISARFTIVVVSGTKHMCLIVSGQAEKLCEVNYT